MVLYTVVAETPVHLTLDDGYTYDKRSGVVLGPAGRPTLQNRLAVTEGSAMFDSWSSIARAPGVHSTPHHGGIRAHPAQRALEVVRGFLGRR